MGKGKISKVFARIYIVFYYIFKAIHIVDTKMVTRIRENQRDNFENHSNTEVETAFETKGFVEFLAKFEDSEQLAERQDESEVLRRFEMFEKLPKVIKVMREVMQERVAEDLGINLTEQDLASIDEELNARVFNSLERDFESLDFLTEQVNLYRELPKEVSRLQAELASLGSREALREESTELEGRILQKENKILGLESSQEGMALGREALQTVKDMQEGTKSAEQVFLSEADLLVSEQESVLSNFFEILAKLKGLDKMAGLPGKINFPDLTVAKKDLENAKKKKSNPAEYLQSVVNSGMVERLERIKVGLRRVCEAEVTSLLRFSAVSVDAESKRPQIENLLSEFREAAGEIDAVYINLEAGPRLRDLEADFRQIVAIRHGLGYLQSDPTSAAMREQIEQAIYDFQTAEGQQLFGKIKIDLVKLAEQQTGIENSGASRKDVVTAVSYGNTGRVRRILMGDPEGKLAKKLAGETKEQERLEALRDEVLERIHNVDEADRELSRTNAEFLLAKGQIFSGLIAGEKILRAAKERMENQVNTKMASENLSEVLAGRASMEKLVEARETQPDLYGSIEDDDEDDIRLYGGRTLKQLKNDFLTIFSEKLKTQLARALESLDNKTLTPAGLAKSLKDFETNLGGVADTESYKSVRRETIKSLLSPASSLSVAKKIALRALYNQMERRGFSGTIGLDFQAFLTPA